ncbi:ABC transporter substrate-binding protein [bacterium]|nr:ABC transporter substrate-binding protein [bacterium]
MRPCCADESGANPPIKTLTDQAGRQVKLSKVVANVVTAYRPATMIIYALGGHKKVSTRSSFPGSFPLLLKINPNYKIYEDLGSKRNGLNYEGVLATNPDLVVLFPGKEGTEAAERLVQLGTPAIVVDPESVPKLFVSIHVLGAALGLETEADSMVARLQAYLDLVQARTGPLRPDQRKKAYFAAPHSILTTSSRVMMQHSMIELAGGIDVVKQETGGWVNISPEQLHAWNPEVIFLSRTCPDSPEELSKDQRFQAITAVRQGQVFRLPSNLNPWDYPSCENPLAIVWMSRCLYPELYKDIDFKALVNEYYTQTYKSSYDALGGIFD